MKPKVELVRSSLLQYDTVTMSKVLATFRTKLSPFQRQRSPQVPPTQRHVNKNRTFINSAVRTL